MLVLAIETSCDETSAAVLADGSRLLSNIVADQIDVHAPYGGIVPELAGRHHMERIHRVIGEALRQAAVSLEEIDLIAATQGPGLVSSLLVGLNTAKAIAYALNKPLIGINHLEGHLLAVFLEATPKFPFVALVVSGGHTDLYRVNDFGDYRVLGRTRDDAAGECFDKVAKMMGLAYPGGPIIDRLAQDGDASVFRLPRSYLEKGSLDFSFSGIKTAVKYLLRQAEADGQTLKPADLAAGFQSAVTDVLRDKLMLACEREGVRRAVVTGGVASNRQLRQVVGSAGKELGIECYFPRPEFCTDNAAMIACAAYHRFSKNGGGLADSALSLDAFADLAV
jgi:N6-L-threonylcarbamoyladenine synthase